MYYFLEGILHILHLLAYSDDSIYVAKIEASIYAGLSSYVRPTLFFHMIILFEIANLERPPLYQNWFMLH